MIAALADTHTTVWYLFADQRLSDRAREAIDDAAQSGKKIAVSAITLAELIYLIEKDRLRAEVLEQLLEAFQNDHVFTEAPFNQAVARAMRKVSRSQVPDMPDRIIAATAVELGVAVISRDHKIRTSDIATLW